MRKQSSGRHHGHIDETNEVRFVNIPLTPLEHEVLARIARDLREDQPATNKDTLYEVVQCALAEWEHIAGCMKTARLNESLGDCPRLIQYRRKIHLRLNAMAGEPLSGAQPNPKG